MYQLKNNLLKLRLASLTKEIAELENDILTNKIDADLGIFMKIQKKRELTKLTSYQLQIA